MEQNSQPSSFCRDCAICVGILVCGGVFCGYVMPQEVTCFFHSTCHDLSKNPVIAVLEFFCSVMIIGLLGSGIGYGAHAGVSKIYDHCQSKDNVRYRGPEHR